VLTVFSGGRDSWPHARAASGASDCVFVASQVPEVARGAARPRIASAGSCCAPTHMRTSAPYSLYFIRCSGRFGIPAPVGVQLIGGRQVCCSAVVCLHSPQSETWTLLELNGRDTRRARELERGGLYRILLGNQGHRDEEVRLGCSGNARGYMCYFCLRLGCLHPVTCIRSGSLMYSFINSHHLPVMLISNVYIST
jgi:hypothetical protein